MYITKQSLLPLSIPLFGQEYITGRVHLPYCFWISLCISWFIFRTVFPPIGEAREAAPFSVELHLRDFPEPEAYVRIVAKQHDVSTNCWEKISECACNFALIKKKRKPVGYYHQEWTEKWHLFPSLRDAINETREV